MPEIACQIIIIIFNVKIRRKIFKGNTSFSIKYIGIYYYLPSGHSQTFDVNISTSIFQRLFQGFFDAD